MKGQNKKLANLIGDEQQSKTHVNKSTLRKAIRHQLESMPTKESLNNQFNEELLKNDLIEKKNELSKLMNKDVEMEYYVKKFADKNNLKARYKIKYNNSEVTFGGIDKAIIWLDKKIKLYKEINSNKKIKKNNKKRRK